MKQLELHKKIDNFFKMNIDSASFRTAQELISYNEDAKRYFFSKANEYWLNWIWKNNLLKELDKKVKDVSGYAYRLPELEYLTRMAEKEPELVKEIICSTKISQRNFNPEVIDRFFWITGLLPAEQIELIIPKILKDNWLKLMANFGRSGYEYQRIVQKLRDAKKYNALVNLSEVILTNRSKKELDKIDKFSVSDRIFYLHDISETNIFDALLDPNNTEKYKTLGVLLSVLSKVVVLGKNRKYREEDTFKEVEPFYLLDVDLFTIELNSGRGSYRKHDIENIIAVSRMLIKEILSEVCDNKTKAKEIYNKYISKLPDSRSLYRLKLYATTRCPNIFKNELKDLLCRIFDVGERYFDVEGGAEYHHALIEGFGVLDKKTQQEYVSNVLDYFGATLNDKDKEGWRRRDGLEIIGFIKKYLTKQNIEKVEKVLGKLPSTEPIPQPTMIGGRGGMVSHKSPIKISDYSINEIIKHLQTDWSPEPLKEKFKADDFLNPRGPEGLADELREDFKVRIEDYFEKLSEFFNRESIHPSYLYALLRGVDEMLRNKQSLSDTQYVCLINLFNLIMISGKKEEFKKTEDKSWLADWITVHKMMTDVTLEMLGLMKDSKVFKENKDLIFSIIKYLLSIKYSPNAEDDKREAGEPSSVAINSVRGQAFRAFVQFTYNEATNKLSKEVKDLFMHVLENDKSNAVRFTMGQFLASFYFRDMQFIKNLLPRIFPINEVGNEKLYFATWEGYLASSLYKELFVEFKKYYEHAIKLKTKEYPERKYLKGLDETLAAHLALAYAHFDFEINDPLFKLFWKTPNEIRHYEFVSFIGRHFITRDQAGDKWFEENKVKKEKLIKFWDWILKTNIPTKPKTFSGFGFWINPNKEIIDERIVVKNLAISLKKSEGEIDWDYGLTRRLKIFAEIDPKNTLDVIKNYLLFNGELSKHRRSPMFSLENEIKDALIICYKTPKLKKIVEDLIDKLIEKGSSGFWGLKDVISQ